MKTLILTIALLAASAGRAGALDDDLACLTQLLAHSRGEVHAAQSVPGFFYSASHTEVFVYAAKPARANVYTLPERGLFTDDGDRAFFLRIPGPAANKPLLLSVLQTAQGTYFDENKLPRFDDEEKYTQAVALPDSANAEAERRLHRDVMARLADVPRYQTEYARRFSRIPNPPRLDRCHRGRDLSSQKP